MRKCAAISATCACAALLVACAGSDVSTGTGKDEGGLTADELRRYGPTGEALSPMGFDPGLDHPVALAAPAVPHDPTTVQWICDGACTPQAPGTGYYNVVQDRAGSDVSSPARAATFRRGTNAGHPGLAHFQWLGTPRGPVADLTVGNTHLPDWRAPGAGDPYVGLQYTPATGGFPGGFVDADMVPATSIRYVHLRLRARGCVPPHEPYSSGRVVYYLGIHNPRVSRENGAHGADLAMNLYRFMIRPDGGWANGGIAEPGRARWECAYMNLFSHPTCGTAAVDVDGPSWNLSEASDFPLVRSRDCTGEMARIGEQPFVDVVIDVPRMFVRLIEEGLVTREFLEGAHYAGGIMTGTEFFGPAHVRMQLEEQTIYRADAPIPFGSLLDTMRTGLREADPGFLAQTHDFVYRRTLSLDASTCGTPDCACPPGAAHGARCSDYARLCRTAGRILSCTNGADLQNRWFDIGSARPCGGTSVPGLTCTTAGDTCLSGSDIVACTSRAHGDAAPPPAETPPSEPPPVEPPPVEPPPGSPPSPGTGLSPGFYRLVTHPDRPQFAVGEAGWCWFVMKHPPGGIVDTDVPPQSLGIPDLGRCAWDPRVGNYHHRPSGALYHYDGGGAWCWFLSRPAANGHPIVDTDVLPQALGDMVSAHEGRCAWDL